LSRSDTDCPIETSPIDSNRAAPDNKDVMVPCRFYGGMKREHDRELSSFVAAPATVNGEPENKEPLVWRIDMKS
jgi:hypothetical protein